MAEFAGVAEPVQASVIKCDSCGADMLYDPDKGALTCPYCESVRRVDKTIALLRDFYAERNFARVIAEGTSDYSCPNCGGEVELENFETATACPFCGATNIIRKENLDGIAPDSILPFALSKDKALAAGKRWLKKRIFAPSKLKKDFIAEGFKGVYIPSFSFCSNSFSKYSGRLGERRTRVVGSGKNRRVETYIYWYNVNGSINMPFRDVLTEASTQLTQAELIKISPYDLQSVEEYKREYLAGFCAERYDTSLNDSFDDAKSFMDAEIRKAILARYHADVVGTLNVNTSYADIKFRYALLPLWVCAYKYKEKLYRFIVNGRTGKSTGAAPVSAAKASVVSVVGLGIIALLVWLFAYSGIL